MAIMWKELITKIVPCDLGLFPGWIEVSCEGKLLTRQPFGTNQQGHTLALMKTNPSLLNISDPEVDCLRLIKGDLENYSFLKTWDRIVEHLNGGNELLVSIISDDTSSLLIPFEQLSSLKLKAQEFSASGRDREYSRIALPVGSSSSVIFRRSRGQQVSGLHQTVSARRTYVYVGDTPRAQDENTAIADICSNTGMEHREISDFRSIDTSQPWILYFIGHGGANGLWHDSSATGGNLLPQIRSIDLTNCEAFILSCCSTSSYVLSDETISAIYEAPQKPRHIFSFCYSVADRIAAVRGTSLLDKLSSQTLVHLALSQGIIENAGERDQILSFSWFDCT